MRVEIISISNQLLLSDILNTNAAFVTRVLKEINADITCKVTVGEDVERVADVLRNAMHRADVVLILGEKQNTPESLLTQAVNAVTGRLLDDNGRIDGAEPLSEGASQQTGWWLSYNGCYFVSLPGERREMAYLLDTIVLPRLRQVTQTNQPEIILLRTVGIMESSMKELLSDLSADDHYRLSFDSFAGQTTVRLALASPTAANPQPDSSQAHDILGRLKTAVSARLGDHIFGQGSVRLEDVVLRQLLDSKRTLALAECYTGLALTQTLDAIPGSETAVNATLTATATELSDLLKLGPDEPEADLSRWSRKAAERLLVEYAADLSLIVYNRVTQGGVLVLVTLASPLGVSITQRSFGGHPVHINQWATTLGLAHLRRWLLVHA